MPQHYTPSTLAALDVEIQLAERRHAEALLSMGDDSGSSETWHDNPVFEQAKQDVVMTKTTLIRLKRLREDAVVTSGEPPEHIIDVGSTVIVSIGSNGEESEVTTFHIAGHYVARRPHDDEVFHLGTNSPLGKVLVGKTEGDKVSYQTPNGKTLEAAVLKIVS